MNVTYFEIRTKNVTYFVANEIKTNEFNIFTSSSNQQLSDTSSLFHLT